MAFISHEFYLIQQCHFKRRLPLPNPVIERLIILRQYPCCNDMPYTTLHAAMGCAGIDYASQDHVTHQSASELDIKMRVSFSSVGGFWYRCAILAPKNQLPAASWCQLDDSYLNLVFAALASVHKYRSWQLDATKHRNVDISNFCLASLSALVAIMFNRAICVCQAYVHDSGPYACQTGKRPHYYARFEDRGGIMFDVGKGQECGEARVR
ncbi:hypothetical protein BJ912DRAFT_934262 [Pholiota molesta]|nr:hypothetical protein BJ912DRAFT_934262 [Pholiota molesta]